MFNVLLGEFLSQPIDGAFGLKAAHCRDKNHRNTYLAYLFNVCDESRLNSESGGWGLRPGSDDHGDQGDIL